MNLGRLVRYSSAFVLMSITFARAATGRISGTVLDDHGVPVAHLLLNYEELDDPSRGGIPQTETDRDGHFSIQVTVARREDGTVGGGKWAMYPHHDLGSPGGTGYYPPNSRFYRTEHSNWQEIDVTPEAPDAVVEIRLGAKAGS